MIFGLKYMEGMIRMWRAVLLLCLAAPCLHAELVTSEAARSAREEKVLSVFNVVTFPNSACGASNGYNGTCYTSSECTTKVISILKHLSSL